MRENASITRVTRFNKLAKFYSLSFMFLLEGSPTAEFGVGGGGGAGG